ncbi:MAG: SGNH/GDSL hydrolase family protein [Gammaproteobacteria bacterium]|nr:SGNH/GDSL hydrolase family protein [Gammaproteobacteria bacterium]
MTTAHKLKPFILWLLMGMISFCILEGLLRLYFFQTDSQDPFAIVRVYHFVKNKAIDLMHEDSAHIWQQDPRFGYSHIANASGIHEKADFKVNYTIGPNKERVIPKPADPVGNILFVGRSYTFGHGVNDDENYPYILSRYWRNVAIENKAVSGWGTVHAYMTLQDEVKKGKRPDVVIYSMIAHHTKRNYIRVHWVKQITQLLGNHPHFELIDDQLVFEGVVNGSSKLIDPPDIENKELALTQKFLSQMQKICLEHGIKFVVVGLDYKRPIPSDIIKTLDDNKIRFLDLSSVKIKGFTVDPHPTPDDHRLIADAIAQSFIPDMIWNQIKASHYH